MTSDEPAVDRTADAHDHAVGAEASEQSWRDLGYALTHAESVTDLIRTVEDYGWIPPFAVLALYGVLRGVFEYLVEPYGMAQGYTFPGWELALGINLVYGFFLVTFSWFMYFGVVGALAGFLSEVKAMDVTVFKLGAYLSGLFVPIFVVGTLTALTIPAPKTAVAGTDPVGQITESYRVVYDTPQMQLVRLLKAGGWLLVGFLSLPVVKELYELDEKGSLLAVLPVTVVAVVATQLL